MLEDGVWIVVDDGIWGIELTGDGKLPVRKVEHIMVVGCFIVRCFRVLIRNALILNIDM